MSMYAASNISTAVNQFKNRGYATLGGVILNKRNIKNEEEKVNEFIKNINSKLIGTLDRDEIVVVAEENKKTVLESFSESNMAKEYEILADNLLKSFGYKISKDKKLREYNKDADNEQPSNPDTKEEAKC